MAPGKPTKLREKVQHHRCCGFIIKNVLSALTREAKEKSLRISIKNASKRAVNIFILFICVCILLLLCEVMFNMQLY